MGPEKFFKEGDKCLILSTSPTTWFEALKLCQNLHADLVTVNSVQMIKSIAEKVKSDGHYWTGLHRITWGTTNNNHEGGFFWYNQ